MPLNQPLNLPLYLTKKEAYVLKLNRQRSYILHEDYIYHWKVGGQHYRITVPAGFKYDGASVPRVFWSVVGFLPDGLGRAAALVHDFIYVHKGKMPKGCYQEYIIKPVVLGPITTRDTIKTAELLINPPMLSPQWCDSMPDWTRNSADRMFARLLREGGVPRIRRRLAYRAVRSAGWYWWNK